MAENCGQINIPQTDNSSDCGDFINTACVIVDRRSDLIRGSKGMNLDEYFAKLEGLIRVLNLEVKNIKQTNPGTAVGIGTFED